MGDPNAVSLACNPATSCCSESLTPNFTSSGENSCKAAPAFSPDFFSAAKSTNQSPVYVNDPAKQVCWAYGNAAEYLTQKLQSERETKIGPYLASLPVSSEEGIKTDPKIEKKMKPGVPVPLMQAWRGLPIEVRVYLDNMGFKGATDLAVAMEGPNFYNGAPARWHIMEMSSLNGSNGATHGIGSAGRSSTPPPEPTVNISISGTLVGLGLVGAIVAFDHGVIRKKFPDLPREFMLPINLGTIYGINYLLFKGGFIKAGSWGEVWKPMTNQMPFLAMVGLIAAIGLDRIGAATGADVFRFGQPGNDIGAPLLTLGAYYTILNSKSLSPLARGLIHGGKFSFAAPAGGAGVMGGIGQGLNVAGVFLLGNAAIGLGKSAAFYWMASGESDSIVREMKLNKLVYEMELRSNSTDVFGDTAGGIIDGCLGHLLDGILTLGEIISDDVEKGREYARQEIRDQLVDGSKTFGSWARGNLTDIIARSINMQSGEVDWSQVEKETKELFAKEGSKINGIYSYLEFTGHIATQAQEIKDLMGADGSIPYGSREALKKIASAELKKMFDRENTALRRMVIETGAGYESNGDLYLVPPENLSADKQQKVKDKVIPMTLRVTLQGAALEALSKPKAN